ncbi:FecR family protein [Roseimicrobium gellanilyticum]|uniref:FecR family protein n=1 Tax=Roseimicrobium gellanilyticum TaxID=748857 RepID=A0A366HR20_9BACT|nr:LamG-like jellyroll fold domain-containing protein [Roseimicrobium gellanilyticum]RBP46115.1 FecR family protein [Roseimicrobium gellanilyticum]
MKNQSRTDFLIAGWLNQSLTKEEFAELELVLRNEPDVRKKLRREVNLDSLLREQAGVAALNAWQPEGARNRNATKRRIAAWVPWAAAAALAVLGIATFALLSDNSNGGEQTFQVLQGDSIAPTTVAATAEETDRGCAIITNQWNTEWLDNPPPMRAGDTLNAGRFELGCGLAQIEFFSGAQLLLEGPAVLEIVSPWEAVCTDGKARVRVPPPAQGFRLLTPGMKLVDLGTEFGVHVDSAKGEGEVHVFEGEVEAHPETGKMVSLTEGMGLKRMGALYSPMDAAPADFASIDDLKDLAGKMARIRYDEWDQWSQVTRRDPRLVACYLFRHWHDWDRLVNNAAGNDKSRNGGAVGARWTQGRWPMKDALEFKRPGDRVRMKLDGEYEALTFACWVKVDGLDRKYNALLLTDGYETGEPHWQILEDGRMMFSIAYPDEKTPEKKVNQIYYSPVVFTKTNLGRWHQLVVTYDNCSGESVQFVDGREVSREISPLYQPGRKIVYGACEMGNWGLPTKEHQFPVRNLNGCLDEFLIYSVALDPSVVRQMFEIGKPQ